MPKLKSPGSAERQARDGGAISEPSFMVAVPAHAVAAGPIQVQQHGIERRARKRFRAFAQVLNDPRHCCRLMKNPAIAVSRVPKPSRHAGHRHLAAEQSSCFHLPWHGFHKGPRQRCPIEITTAIVNQHGLAVAWQEIEKVVVVRHVTSLRPLQVPLGTNVSPPVPPLANPSPNARTAGIWKSNAVLAATLQNSCELRKLRAEPHWATHGERPRLRCLNLPKS